MSEEVTFSFSSLALENEQAFTVVDFEGSEAVSEIYDFEIRLKTASADIDMQMMLERPCTFTITVGESVKVFHGMLAEFEELHQIQQGAWILYRARLVPRIWRLSLFTIIEVYLDMSIPEIVSRVLEEGGFLTDDYEFRIKGKMKGIEKEPAYRLDDNEYRRWPFRCQYGENHLNYLSRMLEHDGLYFFFEQTDDRDVLVISDSLTLHNPPQEKEAEENNVALVYAPDSGLALTDVTDKIRNFICQTQRVPRTIKLQDYDYLKPSLAVEATVEVDPKGTGEVFLYGQYFETPEEGEILATIRAEEMRVKKAVYHSESSTNTIHSGCEFDLSGHFRDTYNQRYFVTALTHRGVTPSEDDGDTSNDSYTNSFTCIPATIQFRPERKTIKPRIEGSLRAIIDAEGEGDYAEIDEHGRYKVKFPFDRNDKSGGKASYWLRMAQPYGGSEQGMHFPLRKGTEVLLTFIDGDPDRPVISATVPNADQPSVVKDTNLTNNVIQTGGGNLIEMEDKEGSGRIKLSTPQNKSYMHLGAPNHDGDGWVVLTEGIERKEIRGGQQITVLGKGAVSNGGTEVNAGDASLQDDLNAFYFSAMEGEDPLAVYQGASAATSDGGPLLGTWQYRLDGGSWTNFPGSIGVTSSLYIDNSVAIKFVPNAADDGVATLKYFTIKPNPDHGSHEAIAPDMMYSTSTTTTRVTVPNDSETAVAGTTRAFPVAITTVVSGLKQNTTDEPLGKWQYKLDGTDSDWVDFPAGISNTKPLFLDAGTLTQFLPAGYTADNNSPGVNFQFLTSANKTAGQQFSCSRLNSDLTYKGEEDQTVAPGEEDIINENELHAFVKKDPVSGLNMTDASGNIPMTTSDELSGNYVVYRRDSPRFEWTNGNTYSYGGSKDFAYGNSYEVAHEEEDADYSVGDIPDTVQGALFNNEDSAALAKGNSSSGIISSFTNVKYSSDDGSEETNHPYIYLENIKSTLKDQRGKVKNISAAVNDSDWNGSNGRRDPFRSAMNTLKGKCDSFKSVITTAKTQINAADGNFEESLRKPAADAADDLIKDIESLKSKINTTRDEASDTWWDVRIKDEILADADKAIDKCGGVLTALNQFKSKFEKYVLSQANGDITPAKDQGYVEYHYHDSFEYQRGNKYEWGDTADYSFGDGYEEGHANLGGTGLPSSINKKEPFDLLNEGGPTWTYIENAPDGAMFNIGGEFEKGTVGVEKSYGDAYEYSQGKAIEVSYKQKKQEISVGGTAIEQKYTGEGRLTAEEKSEAGQSWEYSYDPTTGSLLAFEFDSHKHFHFECTIPTYPTLSIATNMSAFLETSIEITLAAKISVELEASFGVSVSGNTGIKIEVEFGQHLELDDGKLVWRGPGSEFEKKKELVGAIGMLNLEKKAMDLGSSDLTLENTQLAAENATLEANIKQQFNL